ncbi:hypothetical protein FRB90_011211 [Tulasnella sp. 427]|nr:hypothetical protein FRB90_011211 [Tulasnella sp. 427]
MDPESVEEITRYGKHVGREVFVWQRVKHPRITPFVGYIREYRGIVPCIVTKRRWLGNLSVYLGKNPNADRLELLCQALEGLVYLHGFEGRSIIHLDIKPENILVTDEGSAELCDFGYAKVLGGETTGFTTSPHPGGTYPYCSPEVLEGAEWKELTPAADIFAIGSTILYILSGKQAWYYIQAKARLIRAVSTATPPIREKYAMQGLDVALNTLWDLLYRCWQLEPEERPSAQEVLNEAMGGVRPGPQAATA